MPHVDDGTLHALLDGALRAEEPDRADRAEAHLETCADCRARLEEAGELRGRAADVLASLDAGADLKVSADFGDVVARAAARTGPGSTARGSDADRVRRQYRWTRGLAWAATIVVALGTGYLVGDLTGPVARPGQELMRTQVPVPPAATDPAESEATSSGDAEPRTEAAPVAEVAEDAPRQQPAPDPERRAAAATAEREEAVDAGTRQQASEARAPDAIEETGLGGVAAGLTDEITAMDWVEVDVTDVENRVGPILVLPGAEVARAELLPGIDTVARTLQVLPDGVEVQVIQTIAATAGHHPGEPADADAAPAPTVAAEADRYSPAAAAADAPARLMATRARSVSTVDSAGGAGVVHGVHETSVARAGVTLTLVGPLPRAVLEELGAAAVPRQQ